MSMTENQGATTTVGAALAEVVARAGVRVAFTVPGEGVLGLLDGLAASRIRVVAARHEGAAAFMAAAVGQLTGRPALCIGTRGPGACNLAVGLHAARVDSAPLIAIVAGVRRDVQGREAFQELDAVAALGPIVKWSAELKNAADALPLFEHAVAMATTGRPGPVLIAVPADLMDSEIPAGGDGRGSAGHIDHQGEPDPTLVRKVLHMLTDSRRPLILAGAGVLRARSTDALVRFAQSIRVPVVSAWRRGDLFPNDNPLYLGMTGPGAPSSVRARLEEADALLVLGSRLGEMTTFGYRIPGQATRWAQVDVDPRGAASPHRPDIVLAADVAAFLRVTQRLLAHAVLEAASLDERTAANARDREAYEAASVVDAEPWDGPGVHPGRVISTLARVLPPEAILTTDAGDFGTWAARGYRFRRPGTYLGSADGPMGYGFPAAIAASLARPGRTAVALSGDGGFAMTMAELETAVRERAHVVAVVLDNGRYGAIWREQEERGAAGGLATKLGPVDFAAIAEACGVLGLSVRSDEEFEPALRQALDAGRPALLHVSLDARWTTPDGSPTEFGRDLAVEAEAEVVAQAVAEVVTEIVSEAAEVAAVEELIAEVEAVEALEAAVEAVEALEAAVEAVEEAEAENEVVAQAVAEVVVVAEATEVCDHGVESSEAPAIDPE
jgi:acetolactate synthase-1/2/3 large subunit